ncbi:MAG: DoxX family protein [Chitinophagales bacterium]
MKKTKIIYWIITLLFAAYMVFSAIPDAMSTQKAIDFLTGMGYPEYFIPFIGVAKILGVIAILIPGFPRIKEWAYAGLAFDLIGATYSIIALGQPFSSWVFMLPPIIFCFTSYFLYHKYQKEKALISQSV